MPQSRRGYRFFWTGFQILQTLLFYLLNQCNHGENHNDQQSGNGQRKPSDSLFLFLRRLPGCEGFRLTQGHDDPHIHQHFTAPGISANHADDFQIFFFHLGILLCESSNFLFRVSHGFQDDSGVWMEQCHQLLQGGKRQRLKPFLVVGNGFPIYSDFPAKSGGIVALDTGKGAAAVDFLPEVLCRVTVSVLSDSGHDLLPLPCCRQDGSPDDVQDDHAFLVRGTHIGSHQQVGDLLGGTHQRYHAIRRDIPPGSLGDFLSLIFENFRWCHLFVSLLCFSDNSRHLPHTHRKVPFLSLPHLGPTTIHLWIMFTHLRSLARLVCLVLA
nr:MAG TPA: hypothetical protein [Caudoviricetes sp.]